MSNKKTKSKPATSADQKARAELSSSALLAAVELLAKKIGVYGERNANPVEIHFGNGVWLTLNGKWQCSGFDRVAEWVKAAKTKLTCGG